MANTAAISLFRRRKLACFAVPASCFAALTALAFFPEPTSGQAMNLVAAMAANEQAAHAHQPFFAYLSEERSARTGNHLWKEKVVETPDGILRRLLAVDGKPLATDQQQAENQRINDLVTHPDDFRKANQNRKDDEAHAAQLLQLLPKAFIVTPDGEHNGCTQFSFRPNPAYEPQTYEERVVHAMAGTVSIREPEARLCDLSAQLANPVEFGFGLLGSITGGHFGLERRQIDGQVWKTDRISVHLDGRILFLKSISRNQDTTRAEIVILPGRPSLAQAAQLSAQ